MNLNNFYPIGTVCKINGYSELVMIVGYQKNTYGTIKKSYNYEGCFYPYGTLTNVKILFNEKEIDEVVFEGYKPSTISETVDNKENTSIYEKETTEEKIYMDDDIFFVKNKVYNQLLFDKDGKVLIAEEAEEK